MSKLGVVTALLAIALALAVFLLGLTWAGTASKEKLIDSWRVVHPGMSVVEVTSSLGTPDLEIQVGNPFPNWAAKSVPENYFETHGLMTFVTQTPLPEVLLVYFDEDGHVTFVSSCNT